MKRRAVLRSLIAVPSAAMFPPVAFAQDAKPAGGITGAEAAIAIALAKTGAQHIVTFGQKNTDGHKSLYGVWGA